MDWLDVFTWGSSEGDVVIKEVFTQMFQDDMLFQCPWESNLQEQGNEPEPVLINVLNKVAVKLLGYTDPVQLPEWPQVLGDSAGNHGINRLESRLEVNQ